MNKNEELAIMKGIAICHKPFLKPEEAKVYCNLEHTQLNKRLREFGIFKTLSGYYKREELDAMMAGQRKILLTKQKHLALHLNGSASL